MPEDAGFWKGLAHGLQIGRGERRFIMNRGIAVVGVVLLGGICVLALQGSEEPKAGGTGKVRVGIYESRCVAVAFGNSKYNTKVRELMEEYKKAEAAGDKKKVEELKVKGEKGQDLLHRQGFGKYPVDDCLVPIKDALPKICKAAGVELIVGSVNYASPSVETVDVTDLLVKEYSPSEKVLQWVKEIRKTPPLEFDQFPIKD
jgi:hypothetical protein